MAEISLVHFAMFAKYWESGKVKTRLARVIGKDAARDVYLMFLQHLVNRFGQFGDSRSVVYSPPDSEAKFREALPEFWSLQPQSGGNLGARMKTFFRENGAQPEIKNILIGSDTPDLPVSIVTQAVDLLDKTPVVLGPSGDGGYYLIAIKGEAVDIFSDIPWSTDQVLTLTIEKLDQQQVSYSLLPELKDVDEYDDLRRLIAKLNQIDRDELEEELVARLSQLELPSV